MVDKFSLLLQTLSSLDTVLISSHVAPDPDAIGSSAALALGLQALGKDVTLYYEDRVPKSTLSLIPTELQSRLVQSVPQQQFSALVVVDTATKERVGKEHAALLARGAITINIDHHVSNTNWAQVNYIDAAAPASAMIVYQILEGLNLPFTTAIANLLWAGLADDTGSFRFSNTTAQALECAAKLVERGADPAFVAETLYYSVPTRVLRLKARALANLRMMLGGQLAAVVVSQALLTELGAGPEDTEGLVDEVRQLEGTVAALLIREFDSGWKLSLRAKRRDLDVGAIAGEFGGGGHRAAAGCRINGSEDEVCRVIEESFGRALARLPAL